MNIEEFCLKFSNINDKMLDFKDFVDASKDICNNYALKNHCQSTFIIDEKADFLAEVFTDKESFFVAINKRHGKNAIAIYTN